MKKITILLFTILSFFSFAEEKIKIGVTLQPYYSFVANIGEPLPLKITL